MARADAGVHGRAFCYRLLASGLVQLLYSASPAPSSAHPLYCTAAHPYLGQPTSQPVPTKPVQHASAPHITTDHHCRPSTTARQEPFPISISPPSPSTSPPPRRLSPLLRPLLRPSVARRSRRASQPLLLSLVSDAGHPATAAPKPRSLSAALLRLRDSLPPSARPFRQPAASSSLAHANIHAYSESLHSHDEA